MSTVKVKHGDGGFFCTFRRKVKIVKTVRDTLKYTSTAEVWYREVSQRQVCVCVCVCVGGRSGGAGNNRPGSMKSSLSSLSQNSGAQ